MTPKPCPRCGSTPEVRTWPKEIHDPLWLYYLKCTNLRCMFNTFDTPRITRDLAIERWNEEKAEK